MIPKKREVCCTSVASAAITRVKSLMLPTRCTRYFVQLPQTEMRLRSELRRRSYKFLNRLTDYQLQFRGATVHVQWRYYPPSLFLVTSFTLTTLLSLAGRRFYRIQLYTAITLHTQLNTAQLGTAQLYTTTTQYGTTRHRTTLHDHNSTHHNSTRPQLDTDHMAVRLKQL